MPQETMREKLLAEFGQEMRYRLDGVGRRPANAAGSDEPGKEDGKTMHAEVRKAKAHVREREAAISNKVEQVGPQAIAAERAKEKQVPKAKAAEETSRARPRIGALMWRQHGAQSGCAIVPSQSPVHAGSVKERC